MRYLRTLVCSNPSLSQLGTIFTDISAITLDTSVVGDVTARRSKMHGEFVSLKQRPVTSRAVFTELNRQLPEFLRLGKPGKHLSLALPIFPTIFPLKLELHRWNCGCLSFQDGGHNGWA